MKKIFFLGILSLILFSCNREKAEIPDNVRKEIVQTGENASSELLSTLKSHLIEALQQGELVEAFEFCAVQAIPLTEEVNERMPEGVEVSRVSAKYRNPANAPDDLDQEALDYFEKQLAETDSLPPYLIRREKEDIFRYYKPLRIEKPCLKCHGARENIDEKVLTSLQENYPTDKAINYQVGEFRGAVKVRIKLK